jgi:hypothetical protein
MAFCEIFNKAPSANQEFITAQHVPSLFKENRFIVFNDGCFPL